MEKVIIVVGAYGSGKSEYSANLAIKEKVAAVVDMDIMNPYFRTRELSDDFAQKGIELVAPEGAFRHTELPMLSPKIQACLDDVDKKIVIDVGGDPTGMKVLGRYKKSLQKRGYDLRLVVNTKRPSTSSRKEITAVFDEFEASSGMKITTLVCNTNLMEFTDANLVRDGVKIVDEVAKAKKVDFRNYCVLKKNSLAIPEQIDGKKMFVMDYFFSKPWER